MRYVDLIFAFLCGALAEAAWIAGFHFAPLCIAGVMLTVVISVQNRRQK